MLNKHRFKYTTREKLQEYIDALASNELKDSSVDCFIKLSGIYISSLEGIQFPEVIKCFHPYFRGIRDHPLTKLRLDNNKLTSLDGVVFPPNLADLQLQNNQITSLDGVVFPPKLANLQLWNNQITSLDGVAIPPGLVSLDLANNKITSFAGMQFPLSLFSLKLEGNPIDIETVSQLKNPSPFVIREIVAAFPETAQHFKRMDEMKERRFEQLRTMMSQLGPMIEERKQTVANFSATTEQGETHTIPFIPEKTVQWAIDYLNDGPLSGKCGKMTLFYNSTPLDPLKPLADLGIVENSTIFIQCYDERKGGRKYKPKSTRRYARMQKSVKKIKHMPKRV